MEKLNNHDEWCIDWYQTLLKDGTAEDGQRIAVLLYDQNTVLQSENAQLRSELKNVTKQRDEIGEDMNLVEACFKSGFKPCAVCKYEDRAPEAPCSKCIHGAPMFEWHGVDKNKAADK